MRIALDDLRHKRWRDVSFDAMLEGARSPLVFEQSVEATQERSAVRERVLRALADVIEGKLTEKQRAVLVAELEGMRSSSSSFRQACEPHRCTGRPLLPEPDG